MARPFCERLATRGYRVIRFDNRDIGQSTRLTIAGVPDVAKLLGQALAGAPASASQVPYTPAHRADDAVGLLDALDIESAHIVDASMGGAIGQEIALRHPARVRTLVSIMATSGAPDLPPPQPQALQVLLTPTPLDRAGYGDVDPLVPIECGKDVARHVPGAKMVTIARGTHCRR